MGNFKIEIEAVGGHGCQRGKLDGEIVNDCGQPTCPDCIARRFVAQLKQSENSLVSAVLVHWPVTEFEVRDDLLSGVRSGSFKL